MSALFEKRNDAWIRAQRAHSDHFIEVSSTPAPPGSADTPPPQFLAVGSAPSTPSAESTPLPAAAMIGGDRMTGDSGLGPAPATARRSPMVWLAGAVLAAVIGVGVTILDRTMSSAGERTIAAALTADVEKLAATFESAARSAHLRADGIATTPMLRAAIETDAATLSDLANTEMVFTADRGEALEVFQFRGDRATSLLRIPKTALSVQPLKGRSTRFQSDARGVTLAASAPISGYRAGVTGGLVISAPVDLTAIRRALAEHAVRATLTGLGAEVPLATASDGAGGSPLKLSVPSSGDWNAGGAAVIAVPRPAAGLIWAGEARLMSWGLAALLLAGFAVQLVRRPRS